MKRLAASPGRPIPQLAVDLENRNLPCCQQGHENALERVGRETNSPGKLIPRNAACTSLGNQGGEAVGGEGVVGATCQPFVEGHLSHEVSMSSSIASEAAGFFSKRFWVGESRLKPLFHQVWRCITIVLRACSSMRNDGSGAGCRETYYRCPGGRLVCDGFASQSESVYYGGVGISFGGGWGGGWHGGYGGHR